MNGQGHSGRSPSSRSFRTGTKGGWQSTVTVSGPRLGGVFAMGRDKRRAPLIMSENAADLRSRPCPRQDSNLRTRLRRAVLYPLSYGGAKQNSTARFEPHGPPFAAPGSRFYRDGLVGAPD